MTGRRVFVTFETHATFHRGYADHMRERTNALIDAYFATDVKPLRRLRDQHDVTHLVIDRTHYLAAPIYFAPFDTLIPPQFEAAQRDGAEALRQSGAMIYDDGTYVVLELSRLR